MKFFKKTPEDWELIDKTILPSAYEQLVDAGQKIDNCGTDSYFVKKIIYTFKNKISGEIKQTEFENP